MWKEWCWESPSDRDELYWMLWCSTQVTLLRARGIHPIPPVEGDILPSLGLALSLKESPQPVIGQGRATLSSTFPSAVPEPWHFWRKSKGEQSDGSITVSHYCPYWGSGQAQGQGSSGSSKTTLTVSAEWFNHLGSAARSTGSEPAAPCSLFKCLFN